MLARNGCHGAALPGKAISHALITASKGKSVPGRCHLTTYAARPSASGTRIHYPGESPAGSSRRPWVSLAKPDPTAFEDVHGNSTPPSETSPESWQNLQRFDTDGQPVFTPRQYRLFIEVKKARRLHNATTSPGQAPSSRITRRPAALALYQFAMDLVSPDVDHGQPEVPRWLEAIIREQSDAQASVLPDAKLIACDGDLSIPTWAVLLKNAATGQNGFDFRVLLERCLKWCGKQQMVPPEQEDVPVEDLMPISPDLESVQTVARLRALLVTLITNLTNVGFLSRKYRPDLSILGDSATWNNLPDADHITTEQVIAVLKAVAPPRASDHRTRDREESAYMLEGQAGAFTSYRTVSVEAQRQCQLLLEVAQQTRYRDLYYDKILERYRQTRGLKWQARRGDGRDKEYYEPFNLLGSPSDPFSAVSVLIEKERLFRWAKVRYGEYDIVDATPQESDQVDPQAADTPPLNVPPWLFYAVLRVMADTGRTTSIRRLIRIYLKACAEQKQGAFPKYFPNSTIFEPLTKIDDPVPASILLNVLIKSHGRRDAQGKKLSGILKDAWQDICLFCLPPEEQPKAVREALATENEEQRGLPLLSPDEFTAIRLLDMGRYSKTATQDHFAIIEKLETYFGRRTPASLPMTGWGKSFQRGPGDEIREWVYRKVDHPGMSRDPKFVQRNRDSRPYMISFTIATARRLLKWAHTGGFAMLSKRALLLSRRWAAQGREQTLVAQANAELSMHSDVERAKTQDVDADVERAEKQDMSADDSQTPIITSLPRTSPFRPTPEVQSLITSLPWDLPSRARFEEVANFLRANPHLIQAPAIPRLTMRDSTLWYNSLKAAHAKGLFDPMPEPLEISTILAEMESYGENVDHQVYLERYMWERRSDYRAGKALLSHPDSMLPMRV